MYHAPASPAPLQAILPKLAAALGQMDINPAAQQLEPWGWAMAWKEVVSAQLMAGLLERAFFPRCAARTPTTPRPQLPRAACTLGPLACLPKQPSPRPVPT